MPAYAKLPAAAVRAKQIIGETQITGDALKAKLAPQEFNRRGVAFRGS